MADTAPMGKDEAIDLLRDALEHYQRLAPDTITAREALRMTAHLAPSTAPTKDHVVRDVVNRLRDTALEFHAHGSLRERLARELEALLVASRPAEVDEEALSLLRTILAGDVGQQTLGKLARGQSTETEDGKAWLAAQKLITAPSHTTNKDAA